MKKKRNSDVLDYDERVVNGFHFGFCEECPHNSGDKMCNHFDVGGDKYFADWKDHEFHLHCPYAKKFGPGRMRKVIEEDKQLYEDNLEEERDGEIEMYFGTHYSAKEYAKLTPKGIFIYRTGTKDGKPYVSEDIPAWKWDDFKIERVLLDNTSKKHVDRYDYTYNGKYYREMTFEEMRQSIVDFSCLETRYKQIFGPLIYKYIKIKGVPHTEYKDICGFSEDGWSLPPKYYINFNVGIQDEYREGIVSTMALDVDPDDAKQKMRKLYDALDVQYKDVILSYGMVAPFLYVMKKYTGIMPWLALYSPEGKTGKTYSAKCITSKFWGHHDEVSSDQLNSVSRARDHLSSSTLPVLMDEIEKLNNVKDMLKSMATGNQKAQYKKRDQTLGMNKPFVVPQIYTFNAFPEMFDDTAFQTRGLILVLTETIDKKRRREFMKVFNETVDGEFGRHVVNEFADLDYKELTKIYEKQPCADLDVRQEPIFRLIHLGKTLLEQAFGFELDLSELKELIRESETKGSDAIFTTVMQQIHPNNFFEYVEKDKLGNIKDAQIEFHPIANWISEAPLRHSTRNLGDGFVYTASHLQDLKKRLSKFDLTTEQLRNILSKRWDNLGKYKNYTVTNKNVTKTYKGFFIPEVVGDPVDELDVPELKDENDISTDDILADESEIDEIPNGQDLLSPDRDKASIAEYDEIDVEFDQIDFDI